MLAAHAAVTVSSYLSGAPWAVATARIPLRQRATTSSTVSLERAARNARRRCSRCPKRPICRRARVAGTSGRPVQDNRLERRGLVERQPDPDDRRSFRVALTSDGASLHGWVREGYENVAARTRDGLAPGRGTPDLRTVLRAIQGVR
jgi:hypothetical protein